MSPTARIYASISVTVVAICLVVSAPPWWRGRYALGCLAAVVVLIGWLVVAARRRPAPRGASLRLRYVGPAIIVLLVVAACAAAVTNEVVAGVAIGPHPLRVQTTSVITHDVPRDRLSYVTYLVHGRRYEVRLPVLDGRVAPGATVAVDPSAPDRAMIYGHWQATSAPAFLLLALALWAALVGGIVAAWAWWKRKSDQAHAGAMP